MDIYKQLFAGNFNSEDLLAYTDTDSSHTALFLVHKSYNDFLRLCIHAYTPYNCKTYIWLLTSDCKCAWTLTGLGSVYKQTTFTL